MSVRFLAFLNVAITCASVAHAKLMDVSEVARRATPAVVLLEVKNADGLVVSTGTGFFISADGTLLTNRHVLEGAVTMDAKLPSGEVLRVSGVLGSGDLTDVAALRVEVSSSIKDAIHVLKLGNSNNATPGEAIVVIGSPKGLEGTVSDGIISARRELSPGEVWLQITAPISPGSSGSPVLNTNAEVIGIATLLVRGGQSLNFALPIESAKSLLDTCRQAPVRSFADWTRQIHDAVWNDSDYLAAKAAIAQEDFAEAIRLLKRVADRFPQSARPHFQLGYAFGRSGLLEEAIEESRKAILLKPDYAVAWYNLGHGLHESHLATEALEAYRRAADLDSTMAEPWYEMGNILRERHDWKAATASYENAIRRNANYAAAWTNLGYSLDQQGLGERARAAYRKAIAIDPKEVNAWCNLGGSLGGAGQYSQAISVLQQAVKLAPESGETWSNLAAALEKTDRVKEAVAAAQRATNLSPNYANAWQNLGTAQKRMGRVSEATAALRHASALRESHNSR